APPAGARHAPRRDRLAGDGPGPALLRGTRRRRLSRRVVRRARRAAAVGVAGYAGGRERPGRGRRAQRRPRRAHGAPARPGRVGRRRLDGLGRAHEPELFEQTAPPARPCVGRNAMIYILLWLLGAPLTLILILFLLGVGRYPALRPGGGGGSRVVSRAGRSSFGGPDVCSAPTSPRRQLSSAGGVSEDCARHAWLARPHRSARAARES